MAPFPDEVDVFTAPHWRMKGLVSLCTQRLLTTDFSSSRDFQAMLTSLYATFTEFKSHEQIENEHIMVQLQQRLRALSVPHRSVSAVHSDTKLSDLLRLVERGRKNITNECEQLRYSRKLKERLEAFTRDFLPHMEEEEEVFQPLLMEYFTYEELKDIKRKVIACHCSAAPNPSGPLTGPSGPLTRPLTGPSGPLTSLRELPLTGLDTLNTPGKRPRTDPDPVPTHTHVSQLPPEVLLKILGYLNPRDLCRSQQVNNRWSGVARTGALWRHLHPVSWSRGDWCNGPPSSDSPAPDGCCEEVVGRGRPWDPEPDPDETECWVPRGCREVQLVQGLVHHLLPAVGAAVRSLVLACSNAASSPTVRQMLSACPRLEHLDLTQTPVTDTAFTRCPPGSLVYLRHLDLSGCDRLTDVTLQHVSRALGQEEEEGDGGGVSRRPPCTWPCPPWEGEAEGGDRGPLTPPGRVWLLPKAALLDIEEAGGLRGGGERLLPGPCPRGRAPCGHSLCPPPPCGRLVWSRRGGGSDPQRRGAPRSLRFLSLSGCYLVTDLGLRALSGGGGLPALEHLDLSGCLLVTGGGLQDLVTACPNLNDQRFFYCDNISGPHATTASGCQNLQCSGRACCRSGE